MVKRYNIYKTFLKYFYFEFYLGTKGVFKNDHTIIIIADNAMLIIHVV